MRRGISKATATLLALALVLAPAQAFAQYYFWWQVTDEYGRALPSQTVSCSVYDVASHAAKVMYLQPSLLPHIGIQTAMPLLSDSNSRLHFYSESSADVRVTCYYARGGAATDIRLSRFTHTVMIDRQGRKVVRFPFQTNTTVTRTGIWLPQGAIVRDILVQNTFYGSQSPGAFFESNTSPEPHINVGFAGDHAVTYHSLVDRMHLFGQPLWVTPSLGLRQTAAVTGGLGRRYEDTGYGVHYGIALAQAPRGAVSGPANHQGSSSARQVPYVIHVGAGLELVYQTSNTPNTTGHVYVIYESYHTGVSTTPVSP